LLWPPVVVSLLRLRPKLRLPKRLLSKRLPLTPPLKRLLLLRVPPKRPLLLPRLLRLSNSF
jgi:hypothetical protein